MENREQGNNLFGGTEDGFCRRRGLELNQLNDLGFAVILGDWDIRGTRKVDMIRIRGEFAADVALPEEYLVGYTEEFLRAVGRHLYRDSKAMLHSIYFPEQDGANPQRVQGQLYEIVESDR